MQDNLQNRNTSNNNTLPSLQQVRRNNTNQQYDVNNELKNYQMIMRKIKNLIF